MWCKKKHFMVQKIWWILDKYVRRLVPINVANRHLVLTRFFAIGCGVNCNKKEEYITRIMELELSCQRSIMQAIQVSFDKILLIIINNTFNTNIIYPALISICHWLALHFMLTSRVQFPVGVNFGSEYFWSECCHQSYHYEY